MSEPKKNHYISQFYLRGFTFNPQAKNPQCFFYHIPKNSNIVLSNIENIASERDLFALILPNGEKDYILEKDFSQQETILSSNLASIINKIQNNIVLNTEEENTLIDLLLFQFKRSVIVSGQYKQKIAIIKQETKKEMNEKYPAHNLIEEDFDKAIKNSAISLLKEGKFEEEFEKHKVKNILLARNRYFFQITDYNKAFVTSDMPLYRYNKQGIDNGLNNPNTQIIFPLSAKILMLVYENGKKRKKIIINNNEFIKKANSMIISSASNFIIGNSQKLIQKMKERKNGGTKKYLYPSNDLFLLPNE